MEKGQAVILDSDAVRITPDWVILGVEWPAEQGCMVLASVELTRAELVAEYYTRQWDLPLGIGHSWSELNELKFTLGMKSYSIATGKDYAEALRNLFSGGFNPDEKKGLPPATPELEP